MEGDKNMVINFNVAEYSISSEYSYQADILDEGKQFPILTIGRDSYIGKALADVVPDRNLIYDIQIGRYCSLAAGIRFIVDLNHDYKKVCQGRITGIEYHRPEFTKRKGHIHIMNDCWIGENVTILSGVTIGNGAVIAAESVVASDVPDYAIVAGNPAKIIGYRFSEAQRDALLIIRWWNWTHEKVAQNANLLYGDIDTFIALHLENAKNDLTTIIPANTLPISKNNSGEEKILLYIPDFEQDYPTYPKLINSFVKSFSDTNYELLLYVKEDDFLEDKLSILDQIFSQYEDANCYINLFIGKVEDERSLFGQVDAYITNRSLDNIYHVDMARMYDIPVISSVDFPIFNEVPIKRMIPNQENSSTSEEAIRAVLKPIKMLSDKQKMLQENIDDMMQTIFNISKNQYILNSSFSNLKYEIFADSEKPIYPIIEDGEKAIDLIINEGKSICRFGDGEFAVIAGVDRQKFQRADKKLGQRLTEVLQSNNPNILICIADTYGDLSKYNEEARYNIRAYTTETVRQQHYALLDMSRTYYDTYLTRPYVSYIDNHTDAPKKRFDHLRKIWENRDLLIIEGEKTRMGIGNDLFQNAKSIIRILGPAEHAFDRYDDILSEAKKQNRNLLVLIAMGATATVLAYDLTLEGFQALDIGHVDMEYEWMLAGKGIRVSVPTKYNNEFVGGDRVANIIDETYEQQIIARCY